MQHNPSVDPEEIARFSRIAEEWWAPEGKFKPLHELNPVRLTFIRDHIVRHFGLETAPPLSGLKILDVGCGGGLLCEPLTRLGAHMTGIDASERNIQVASTHAEKSGLSVNYKHTTAEALVAERKEFDVVLALEIVEHVADIGSFLASCTTLVKPGGLLFLSTINRTLKSYALAIVGAEYVLRWLPRGTHQWDKFLRPSELAAYLRQNRLELMEMTGVTYQPMRQHWQMNPHDLGVNYMLVAKK